MALRFACPRASGFVVQGLRHGTKKRRCGGPPPGWVRDSSSGSASASLGLCHFRGSGVRPSTLRNEMLWFQVCHHGIHTHRQGKGDARVSLKDGLLVRTSSTHPPLGASKDNDLPEEKIQNQMVEVKDGVEANGVGGLKEDEDGVENKTLWQKVKHYRDMAKLMWKRYGLVAIGFYYTMYLSGLGSIFLVLDTGLWESTVDTSMAIAKLSNFVAPDGNANTFVIEKLEWLQATVEASPRAENFVLAFVGNEVLDPAREILVLVLTPRIARALGRAPPK